MTAGQPSSPAILAARDALAHQFAFSCHCTVSHLLSFVLTWHFFFLVCMTGTPSHFHWQQRGAMGAEGLSM